ncbi:2896_t:CDS:2 [Ambispora gerdemannii]|uniref:Protein PBN1 n=1 Tax=Ambispora gerdemannii TaxID=144530 RepID=A0A9N8VHC7_9GLOM|nr:2896_t:CDS:2 [Ambispora gerdemannii]
MKYFHVYLTCLIVLLFVHGTVSTLRHRYSFFFDTDIANKKSEENNSGTETFSYWKNDTVRVKDFSGVYEWKLIVPINEFLKTLVESRILSSQAIIEEPGFWQKEWTARIQIASENLVQVPPYFITPLPGLHVGISVEKEQIVSSFDPVRNSKKSWEFVNQQNMVDICKFLDAIFGIFACDHNEQYKKLKYDTIDITKSIPISNGGESNAYLHGVDDEHQSPPSLFDFVIKYDEKLNAPIVDLRIVWWCRDRDIEISKNRNLRDLNNERVEIGLFEPPIGEDTFFGLRTVIGQGQNKILPTMVTIQSKSLHSDTFEFYSHITPPQSFHPKFHTFTTTPNKQSTKSSSCQNYIIHILPEYLFVDPYQVQEIFEKDQIGIWGETDLEKPVGTVGLKCGSIISIKEREKDVLREDDNEEKETSLGVTVVESKLPIHVRYQQPVGPGIFESRSHIPAFTAWPMVVQLCHGKNNSEENSFKESPFESTPLPISLIFPKNDTTKLKYFLPVALSQDSPRYPWSSSSRWYWPIERLNIPVGQLQQLSIVKWWSLLASTLGFVCIVWVTLQKFFDWDYFFDKNKME